MNCPGESIKLPADVPVSVVQDDIQQRTVNEWSALVVEMTAYEFLVRSFRSGETPIGPANCCGAHTEPATDLAPTQALLFQLFDLVPVENRSGSAGGLARFCAVLTGVLKTSDHTLTNDGALEFRHGRDNGEHGAAPAAVTGKAGDEAGVPIVFAG